MKVLKKVCKGKARIQRPPSVAAESKKTVSQQIKLPNINWKQWLRKVPRLGGSVRSKRKKTMDYPGVDPSPLLRDNFNDDDDEED